MAPVMVTGLMVPGSGAVRRAWKELEARFLDLPPSSQSLTISAEGKSYTLPAVDAPDWKKPFTDRC